MNLKSWLLNRYFWFKNYSILSQLYFRIYVALKGIEKAKPIVIIFGMGRVGSTLLVNLLNQTNGILCDGEILDRRVYDIKSFIALRAIQCSRPFYAFRVKHFHINRFNKLTDADFIKSLTGLSIHWIYIERLDLKRVALSAEVAKQTKMYNTTDISNFKSISIPIQLLVKELQFREMEKKREKNLLKQIEKLFYHIQYERDLSNSFQQQKTIDLICDKLEINSAVVGSNLKKLSNHYSKIIENYGEIKSKFLNE